MERRCSRRSKDLLLLAGLTSALLVCNAQIADLSEEGVILHGYPDKSPPSRRETVANADAEVWPCAEEMSEVKSDDEEDSADVHRVRWPASRPSPELTQELLKRATERLHSLALETLTANSTPHSQENLEVIKYFNESLYGTSSERFKQNVKQRATLYPAENVKIFSQPLCYSASGSPLFRQCTSSGWSPRQAPLCASLHPAPPDAEGPDAAGVCPPGFHPVPHTEGKLCLWLDARPAPWREACLRLGAPDSLLDLKEKLQGAALAEVRRRGVHALWLPGRRARAFGPVLRRLPGRRWLDPFPDPDEHRVPLGRWDMREECVWMNASDGAVATAPCDALQLPTACVAHAGAKKALAALICPEDFIASRHPAFDPFSDKGSPSSGFLHCFRALGGSQGQALEESLENHSCPPSPRDALPPDFISYIVPHLVKRLSLNDNEPCWTNFRVNEFTSQPRVESPPYVTNSTAISEDTAIAVYKTGHIIQLATNQKLRCTVCEMEVPIPEVEMSLRRDRQRNRLLLSVYGSSGLWVEKEKHYGFRCFTNAMGGYDREVDVKRHWSRRWTVDQLEELQASLESGRRPMLDLDVEKTLFELKYDKDSAGHYWCEGHALESFKKVRSNIVLVHGKTKGHVYSLVVDIYDACNVNSTDCDSTFHENFEQMEEYLKNLLPKKFISEVRFMRILNITENRTESIIFHVVPDFCLRNPADDFNLTKEVLKTHLNQNQRFSFRSLLSTEGCVPLAETNGHMDLQWSFTPLGSVSASEQLCLEQDGLPVSRSCMGDFITGGRWGPVSGSCSKRIISSITASLHEICTRNVSVEEGHSVATNVSALTSDPKTLSPADIYYTARTMRNLAGSNAFRNAMSKADATSELTAVSEIVNHISLAKDKVVSLAQKRLNSSNMLLDAVDVLFDRISSLIEDMDNQDVLLAVTPYVLIQICDVRKTNVTGLALLRKDDNDSGEQANDFTKFDVLQLDSSKRLETVLEYSGLEVAVWAPQNLVEYIFNSTGNGTWYDPPNQPNKTNSTTNIVNPVSTVVSTTAQSRIVIVLFYKDLTFYNATEDVLQEETGNGTDSRTETVRRQTRVGSRIVSITIPGFSQSLPVPIPIVFRPLVEQAKSRECAYWDFTYNGSTPSQSRGGWSSEGCVYAGNSTIDSTTGQLDVCLCTHLTHFAELLGSRYGQLYLEAEVRYEDLTIMNAHNKALDVITLMGCCLSLFGIIGIIVTAITFRSWRQKPGSKILLQLSTALAFQIILLMVSGTLKTSKDDEYCQVKVELNGTTEMRTNTCGMSQERDTVCIIIGAFLHYFSLAAFTWMFVSALLQFMRYVKILGPTRPPRFFVKSLFFGWGVPLIPVTLLVCIDPDSYVQISLCYPSGLGLYIAVLIPILTFLTMNLSVFVMVINSIVRGPDGRVRASPERKLVISQLKLSVLLFFLLGLSWLLGLLVVSGAGIIFSYLFCISATLQGFVIFVFFVACDPATRKMWQSTFGSWSNLVLLKLGPTESNADLTSSVSTIHREPTTDTTDTM